MHITLIYTRKHKYKQTNKRAPHTHTHINTYKYVYICPYIRTYLYEHKLAHSCIYKHCYIKKELSRTNISNYYPSAPSRMVQPLGIESRTSTQTKDFGVYSRHMLALSISESQSQKSQNYVHPGGVVHRSSPTDSSVQPVTFVADQDNLVFFKNHFKKNV